jgi:hypothetical protein
MPERIQLKRSGGWRLPKGAVSVARPASWGNPYTVVGAIENGWAATEADARKVAVEFFRTWLLHEDPGDSDTYRTGARIYDRRWMVAHLPDLTGRAVACWCPLDGPCHGDVLLEAANSPSGYIARALLEAARA